MSRSGTAAQAATDRKQAAAPGAEAALGPARRTASNPLRTKPAEAARKSLKGRGSSRGTRGHKRRSYRKTPRRSRSPEISEKQAKAEAPAEERDRYAEGYKDGIFVGGESLLEGHLPPDLLFPNVSLEEFLAAGIAALRHRGIPLLGTQAVYEELERALTEKQPYSLVRLGDGELLTLAQDTVLSLDEVRREGNFLSYAGVDIPDYQGRDELASCIRSASMVGVPLSRRPLFQPLLFAIWRAYGVQPESLRFTSSTVNYSLKDEGYLHRLLAGRRVVTIGNLAVPLAQSLLSWGAQIAGTVSPVRGIADYKRAVEEASKVDFDLALVSAGVAAVPICVHLANRTGKVAVDFGHLANLITGLAGHPGRNSAFGPNAQG
ncbi:GT-D fold domain-containing glycosyltransferase [Cohnella sp. AR92]|uniref:GT-D fold domain-containing protein n=1 Tax=Cohnella sp. AR92 TaxID=648716 RepID=UPI001EDCC39D|nr:GT-D fold domain-containing glycosyltransferase [Cohnella sp. AR92]